MQIAIVLHLRQLIFVVVSHICFSTIMQSFACFPAVTASAREKANIRKISLFNGNIHTKKANTCNWMLMSTEYSLLSGKETSRCFYSVAWCIYTLLFPLFGQFVLCMCRNDASPSSQLQQQRQQICFTYKFIFFALFSLLETPEITTAVFFRGNNMKHGGCQYIVDKVNETGEVGCC